MKISCKVAEDLLPLYRDGICSDESAALVKDHLSDCSDCRDTYSLLANEIEGFRTPCEDMKPLADIRKKWKKETNVAIGKGVCIMLAALLLISAVWGGIWYFTLGQHYIRLSRDMTKVPSSNAVIKADYAKAVGDYLITLTYPDLFGEGGCISVRKNSLFTLSIPDSDGNQSSVQLSHGLYLQCLPQADGGYEFTVLIDYTVSGYRMTLAPDLTIRTDALDCTEGKLAAMEYLLDRNRDDIIGMFNAIEELWGIKYLTVE